MLTNLEGQLKQQSAAHRLDEVLAEIPRVREDLGFIPLVTPTSQIVGTQACSNVLTGERYKTNREGDRRYPEGRVRPHPGPGERRPARRGARRRRPGGPAARRIYSSRSWRSWKRMSDARHRRRASRLPKTPSTTCSPWRCSRSPA